MNITENIHQQLASIKKVHLMFRAINRPLRIKMLEYIEQNENTIVTSIYEDFGIDQSKCSNYLGILRKAGLVTSTRAGQTVTYKLNKNNIKFFYKKLIS